ncbi:MAG TPA: hypothetical protein VGL15_02780 [Vicinamibacteria bacterium]
MKTATTVTALLAASLAGFGLAAARRHRTAASSEAPPSATLPPAPPLPLAPKLSPPTTAETAEVLRRAFGGVVAAAPDERPAARDFNGDGREDFALAVRPAEGRLADVNDPLANWVVQDALVAEADRERAASGGSVQPGERLLAVVHGYGAEGWRSPEARQCYLVRHAAGPALEARPRRALLGNPHRPQMPGLVGDVIMTTVDGRRGFVSWTGARYAWVPLSTPGGGR